MHSYMFDRLPPSFDGTWVLNSLRNTTNAGLRTATELYIPRHCLNFSARLPLHFFPKIWNEVNDKKLKNTMNATTFKQFGRSRICVLEDAYASSKNLYKFFKTYIFLRIYVFQALLKPAILVYLINKIFHLSKLKIYIQVE